MARAGGVPDQLKSLAAIDLLSLNYALQVEQYGSFRRAAEALAIRPSVVSRRIQSVEDALGVSLFQRQSQGVSVTQAGRRILATARNIIEESQELLRVARQAGAAHEGTLCIGVVSSITGGGAHRLLKALLAMMPNLHLILVEGATRDHIAAVRALRMDATFVVGAPSAEACEIKQLWLEQIMVAMASSHPLANRTSLRMDVLSDETFIVSKVDPGPEIHDYVVQRLAKLGHHPIIETRAVQRDGLIALVGLGQGISLVCAGESEVIYPDVIFRPLEGEAAPFNLIWSHKRDNPMLRRFLSLARTYASREIHGDGSTLTPSVAPSQSLGLSP